MQERQIKLSGAPALLMFSGSMEKAMNKGTILFYHGLYASKETNRKELGSLAVHGFLAVGIDNVGHGQRKPADSDSGMKKGTFGEIQFLEMVRDTIQEVPAVVSALVENGFSDPTRIGVCGISMGGYIAYGAVLAEPRLKAAAPILGSPRWSQFHHESPHLKADKFFPTALLSQNAGRDTNVPPHYAREFHESLQPHYSKAPERLSHIEFPDSSHFMSEKDWNSLWGNTLDWFDRFI